MRIMREETPYDVRFGNEKCLSLRGSEIKGRRLMRGPEMKGPFSMCDSETKDAFRYAVWK